jgi:hypothetical protein
MEDDDTCYDHLVSFNTIWYILCPFGTFYGHLVHIFPVLVCCTKKNLATPLPTYICTYIVYRRTGATR